MKAFRLLPVLLAVALLVALTSWWDGTDQPVTGVLSTPRVPAAAGVDALSSTWFCAAGTAGTARAPTHSLILTNPSDEVVDARLTAYDTDGEAGAEVVQVPAQGINRLRVDDLFEVNDLSVMVESAGGELAVEHRLISADGGDQVPCATTSSDEWFFPAQTTTLGTSAQLVLFNPFSSDAGVDITAAVDDGIRVPSEWAGLVVPAGTTRTIDLGEFVQRREIFSLSVLLRNGRVIAETTQAFVEADGPEGAELDGIRMQLGVPDGASRWSFATGFTGPGVSERLVVFNPRDRPAEVVVQITPVGGAEMPPEPFELDVAGGRYQIIDLSDEGRVPPVGHHSIQVETDGATPVVVGRVVTVTGPPEAPEESEDGEDGVDPAVVSRPEIGTGTAIGTGSPLVATRWLVPLVITGEDQDPAVVVHNPGSGTVVVSAVTLAGEDGPVEVADEVEVAPGDGLVLPLAGLDLPDGDVGVVVTASSPVLVERVVTFVDQNDLSMGLAVPHPPAGGGRFTPISGL